MAKVFLDTNIFIDAIHRRPEKQILESLLNHIVYISPLSVHIYCYSSKIKIPNSKVRQQIDKFQLVNFSRELSEESLDGPTTDFEDNIQLNSAAEANCEIFLTNDKKLLNLKFFGKTKILPQMAS
jgi:predicted nucleic acid-binding protein